MPAPAPDAWPPLEAVCPRETCNGMITPESLQLDPRGVGECGRCGTTYQWRDDAWFELTEPTDKPHPG